MLLCSNELFVVEHCPYSNSVSHRGVHSHESQELSCWSRFAARLLEEGELDTIECESAEAALATMNSIEPDADCGAVEHKSARSALRRANEHSRSQSSGRGGIIEDGGHPCPGGNRRIHWQILAAAKRYCPSRTARVTEPSQLNVCRSLSVFDQP